MIGPQGNMLERKTKGKAITRNLSNTDTSRLLLLVAELPGSRRSFWITHHAVATCFGVGGSESRRSASWEWGGDVVRSIGPEEYLSLRVIVERTFKWRGTGWPLLRGGLLHVTTERIISKKG